MSFQQHCTTDSCLVTVWYTPKQVISFKITSPRKGRQVHSHNLRNKQKNQGQKIEVYIFFIYTVYMLFKTENIYTWDTCSDGWISTVPWLCICNPTQHLGSIDDPNVASWALEESSWTTPSGTQLTHARQLQRISCPPEKLAWRHL